jgi:hypothetical protein
MAVMSGNWVLRPFQGAADRAVAEALWLIALEGRWPLLPRAIRGSGSNCGKSNESTADLGLFESLGRLTISVATVRTGSGASVEVVGVGDSVLL